MVVNRDSVTVYVYSAGTKELVTTNDRAMVASRCVMDGGELDRPFPKSQRCVPRFSPVVVASNEDGARPQFNASEVSVHIFGLVSISRVLTDR